jgi:NIMA (never in mitosis gene a)-related kinase
MDRYKKVKQIGKGAFGAAILVHGRNDPKAQYVIKLVDVSRLKPKECEEAKKEIKLLASFHHPNIVRYRDSFLESGRLHIVMDFAEGGDLANLLKEQGTRHLPEDQVLDYFVQLCLAMKHVHDRKVLHRDIKSQNGEQSHAGHAARRAMQPGGPTPPHPHAANLSR